MSAVRGGDKKIIKFLLKNGSDINEREDMNHETPLYAAVKREKFSVIRMLLKHGANPNIKKLLGLTPLHKAVAPQDVDTCKAYDRREYIKTEYRIGMLKTRSKLSGSMRRELVALLLNNSADIKAQDFMGRTPLHTLIENSLFDKKKGERRKMAEVLLQHEYQSCLHADSFTVSSSVLLTKDNDGRTPLNRAVQAVTPKFVELLLQYSNKNLAKEGNVIRLNNLLGIPDSEGMTPLEVAKRAGYDEIETMLLRSNKH